MADYLTRFAADLARLDGVVYGMEREGVPIDLGVCAEIEGRALADAAETRRRLDAYAGERCGRPESEANWNYAKWLIGLLHSPRPHGLGLAPSPYFAKGRCKPGEVTTDARALEYLASVNPDHRAFLNDVRAYRRQQRMAGYARTWIDLAVRHEDGTHRLHPSFGMGDDADDRPGAKTGRFGIKNPPLQQVPRDKRKDPYRLRRAFVAPPGKLLVVADYSQLEVVILAHLCVVLGFGSGLADRLAPGAPDLHSATARYVFGEVLGQPGILSIPVEDVKASKEWGPFRDQIKAVRYGLNYGKGDYGFGNTLFEVDAKGEICGPPLGEERARKLTDALFAFDPEIPAFQAWMKEYAYTHRAAPSLRGRWAPLPGIRGDRWERGRAERQAMNWPMQAGGQEITAAAMLRIAARGLVQTLQVHDEIHVLADEDRAEAVAAEVKDAMEGAFPLRAYLKAEPKAGRNWEECK